MCGRLRVGLLGVLPRQAEVQIRILRHTPPLGMAISLRAYTCCGVVLSLCIINIRRKNVTVFLMSIHFFFFVGHFSQLRRSPCSFRLRCISKRNVESML